MALQILQVPLANVDQAAVSFPTPGSSTYVAVPGGVAITDGSASVPVGLSCDAVVPGTPQSTVNLYLSGKVTGVATVLVMELP